MCVWVRAVVVSVLHIYNFHLRPGYNVFTEQSKNDTTDMELRFGTYMKDFLEYEMEIFEGGQKAQPEYLHGELVCEVEQ